MRLRSALALGGVLGGWAALTETGVVRHRAIAGPIATARATTMPLRRRAGPSTRRARWISTRGRRGCRADSASSPRCCAR